MKYVITDSSLETPQFTVRTERGIALVMALIITLVVFIMIGSTMYVIMNATKMSGAGRRYASASEAADGGVEVMKDAINLVMYGTPISSLPQPFDTSTTANLAEALTLPNKPTKVTMNLAGTYLDQRYTVELTVERLYSMAIPGGRVEFGRSAGGSGGTSIFFRINAVVKGPNNTRAETTAVYRFVG